MLPSQQLIAPTNGNSLCCEGRGCWSAGQVEMTSLTGHAPDAGQFDGGYCCPGNTGNHWHWDNITSPLYMCALHLSMSTCVLYARLPASGDLQGKCVSDQERCVSEHNRDMSVSTREVCQ